MKTHYPNSLPEEKYLRTLNWEFKTSENLKFFSEQQIETPISRAVEATSATINRFESGDGKLLSINTLRKILKGGMSEEEENKLPQCESIILCQIEKVEDMIKSDMEYTLKVPFPKDHIKEYLDFISKMARKVVQEICAATEAKISHADGIEYERLISGHRDYAGEVSQDKQSKTFAEIEQERSGAKESKRKVSFSDRVGKKSRSFERQ